MLESAQPKSQPRAPDGAVAPDQNQIAYAQAGSWISGLQANIGNQAACGILTASRTQRDSSDTTSGNHLSTHFGWLPQPSIQRDDKTDHNKSASDEPNTIQIGKTQWSLDRQSAEKGQKPLTIGGVRLSYKRYRLRNDTNPRLMPPLPRRLRDIVPFLLGEGDTPPEVHVKQYPRIIIDVEQKGDKARAKISILDPLDLNVYPAKGARSDVADKDMKRNQLTDILLHINDSQAWLLANLKIDDDYPKWVSEPTEVKLLMRTRFYSRMDMKKEGDKLTLEPLSRAEATVFKALHADFDLKLHLELQRLDAIAQGLGLKPGEAEVLIHKIEVELQRYIKDLKAEGPIDAAVSSFSRNFTKDALAARISKIMQKGLPRGVNPKAIRQAVDELVAEITNPGLTITGTVRIASVPIGYFRFSADTTRETRSPLEGSSLSAGFPYTLFTLGPTLIPPGKVSDVANPALGLSLDIFREDWGFSASAAGRPFLGSSDAGVLGLVEGKFVKRFGSGFDVGLQFSLKGEKSLLGGGGESSGSLSDDIRNLAGARNTGERGPEETRKSPPGLLQGPDIGNEMSTTISITKRF